MRYAELYREWMESLIRDECSPGDKSDRQGKRHRHGKQHVQSQGGLRGLGCPSWLKHWACTGAGRKDGMTVGTEVNGLVHQARDPHHPTG